MEVFENVTDEPIIDQLNLTPEIAASYTQALFGNLARQINVQLNDGLDFEKVLDFTFDSLRLLIPFDRLGIALIDEQAENVKLVWVKSKLPIQNLQRNYSAPLKGSSLARLFETGEPRTINDLIKYGIEHPESESTKLILKDGVRSSLTCPLVSSGKPIGILFFSSAKLDTYDHDHVEVFNQIAGQLAVIVEYGRLKKFFSENLAKAQSLRMVIHDLKAPLCVISGYLALSAEENWYRALDPDAKEIFKSLKRNTQYMFQLIDDLAEFSELQRNLTSLDIHPVNVVDFCEEMKVSGEILMRNKEIILLSQIEALPEYAQFDDQRVRRVIENLFTNAIKFSNRRTTVTFSVKWNKSRLEFTVSDQGIGIPENELSKLFQEFGKTSARPTEGESSTGLGLAIAKQIVEQHGGKISVTSWPDRGSSFSFWIPV